MTMIVQSFGLSIQILCHISLPCDIEEALPATLPSVFLQPMSISTANIKALSHSSPEQSTASLNRYLESSANEDIASVAAMPPALRGRTSSKGFSPESKLLTMRRSTSHADSDTSMSSVGSMASNASFKSVDNRGARRGRKRWTGVSSDQAKNIDSGKPGTLMQGQGQGGYVETSSSWEHLTRNTIFCTWPDCDKKFRNRSSWVRHEEAMHYCPYHWICCSDLDPKPTVIFESCFGCDLGYVSFEHVAKHHHFESCLNNAPADRTFLRKDQLVQHITAKHMKYLASSKSTLYTLQRLAAAWKTDNSEMPEVALYCGFCGDTFLDWTHRQNHVYNHFFDGANTSVAYFKSTWQLNRFRPPRRTSEYAYDSDTQV
jgi:hypothetical protein